MLEGFIVSAVFMSLVSLPDAVAGEFDAKQSKTESRPGADGVEAEGRGSGAFSPQTKCLIVMKL